MNSVYHDLGAMKAMALTKAKEHNCNYNVIISCPLNGEFNRAHGSTYEMVADSYLKTRPETIVVLKTDDVKDHEVVLTEDHKSLDIAPIIVIDDSGSMQMTDSIRNTMETIVNRRDAIEDMRFEDNAPHRRRHLLNSASIIAGVGIGHTFKGHRGNVAHFISNEEKLAMRNLTGQDIIDDLFKPEVETPSVLTDLTRVGQPWYGNAYIKKHSSTKAKTKKRKKGKKKR